MTIEQDFLAFINESERPQWYRYAIRLFVASDTFSESDVEALGLALLDGTFNNDLALNADELPGSTPNAESAKTLNAIDEIFGVNALNTDTPLEFNPTGISVVFGENGAGKSGFARIIRKAVRPDAGEEILPNVFITEANKPHAKLIYTTESDEIRSWDLSDGPNRNLSSIRFFDRPHSEMYVDRENAVTFRPYVLSLLTLLSTFSVHLSEFFKREAEVRETPRPKLAGLSAAGAVKEALEGLSATTNAEDLLSSFDFGAEEKVQLDEAQRKVAELHPEARQREIKIRLTSKSRLNSLKQKFGQLDGLASSAAIEQTRAAAHQAKAKRSAANEIAASLYEDAALAGVGEATWITMWTATEGYIRQLTDRDSYLPSFATEAPCPLCHQPLGELAAQRMDNFRAFVESTASSQADQAEKAIEQRIQSIKQALRDLPTVERELEFLADIDAEFVSKARGHLKDLCSRLRCQLSADPTSKNAAVDINPIAPDIDEAVGRIDDWLSTRQDSEVDKLIEDFRGQIAELEDRRILAASGDVVREYVSSQREIARIRSLQESTRTSTLTKFHNTLVEKYVTGELKQEFRRISTALDNVPYAEITPNRVRRGTELSHQAKLVDSKSEQAKVRDVLSEGELMSLGLAGFLTEAAVGSNKNALVFDDPVTSMDNRRRELVAKQLAELAKDRQIIVFTHDLVFLNDLRRQAGYLGTELRELSVERRGNEPGVIGNTLPWKAKPSKERIADLRLKASRLQAEHSTLTDSEYAKQVHEFAETLSRTWEGCLRELVTDQLVHPGTMELRPRMIKILPRFSEEDQQIFEKGYGFTSRNARHYRDMRDSYFPPQPNELIEQVDALDKWFKAIKAYQD